MVKKTYRVVSLKATTPDELFARKVSYSTWLRNAQIEYNFCALTVNATLVIFILNVGPVEIYCNFLRFLS